MKNLVYKISPCFIFIILITVCFSLRAVFSDDGQINLYKTNDAEIISSLQKKTNLEPREFYRLGLAQKNSNDSVAALNSFAHSMFIKPKPFSILKTYVKRKSSHSLYRDAALSEIIEILYAKYEFSDALELYSLLSNNDPSLFFNASLIAANCCVSLKNYGKAADILESLKSTASKNNNFEKLRKIRLAGIYEKSEKYLQAFRLYYSIIESNKISWEGTIAIKNLFNLLQNDEIKFGNNERFLIAQHLTLNNLFEESQSLISKNTEMKYEILQIQNLCGLKKQKEAYNLMQTSSADSTILMSAYAQSIWKYISKSQAVELYETKELYQNNENILQNLVDYYLMKDVSAAENYLNYITANFSTNSENEKYFWLIA